MDYRKLASVSNIFLTGATGVLGARLLVEILHNTNASVYCLSRSETIEQAKQDILKLLYVYDESRSLDGESWRIIPVLGDVSKKNLGLDDSTRAELSSEMDLVIHSAANVNLIASFEKLKPVNVDGVEEVINFCLKSKAPLLFISSFSMIGDKLFHQHTMYEDQLDVGQGFTEMGYEYSKFLAEKSLHAASERGLNWTIVRPGNIWGDSKTGCYPLFETRIKGIYYEMLKTLIETGYTYTTDENFDVSPVDYVAEASLYVAMNIHKTNQKTFHLTSTNPVSFNDLVDCMRSCNYTIRELSNDEYFSALFEDRFMLDGKPYKSTFTNLLTIMLDDDDLVEQAKWDTSNIVAVLAGTTINCPQVNNELMQTYLDYAAKRGWIKPAAEQGVLAEISKEAGAGSYMEHLYDAELA